MSPFPPPVAGSVPTHHGNRLLAALPPKDLACLRPDLEEVALERRMLLHEADGPVERVYFPQDCVLSLVLIMQDGIAVETGMVGCEGLVGAGATEADGLAISRCIVQVAGHAVTLPAARMRRALEESAALRDVVHAYGQVFTAQLMRTVACNARHALEARLARWLLMSLDRGRKGARTLPTTQEHLAEMLGVGRPAVSLVVGQMQKAGLIRPGRGAIEVLDRAGLEATSCECYRALRAVYERRLPHTYR